MRAGEKRTCAVFGAGALGLGFLGPELSADYEMVYADIPEKAAFLDYLTRSGQYAFNETGPSARVVTVRGVRGVNVADADAVEDMLKRADLVFTAVGEPNLPKLAPTLAPAVARRKPGRPLRVLCCENGLEVARRLAERVASLLAGGQAAGRLIAADTVMGRMCRIVKPEEEGFSPVGPGFDWGVAAEPFFGIPVPRRALEGLENPGAAFQVMSDAEFAAQEDVKMCAHNGLHAFLAFLGHLKGRKYFCELAGDAELMAMAYTMLRQEVGAALLRKHGSALDRNFYLNYAPTILRRIICPGLHDTIARGTRGAMRKLEPWERLVGGVRTIASQGIEPRLYTTGLAAAIVVARQTAETSLSFEEVLTRHCGLREDGDRDLLALAQDRLAWLEAEWGIKA